MTPCHDEKQNGRRYYSVTKTKEITFFMLIFTVKPKNVNINSIRGLLKLEKNAKGFEF